jgi:hypothetical protein
MHQFLSVYYFTLLLLHDSATVCHPQGDRLYILGYMPFLDFWLIKILCSMWLRVYYVAAWCVSTCLSICSLFLNIGQNARYEN